MILPQIEYLYLYRLANENTLKIFQDERLWSSKPERFNDPFDCDLEVTKGITEEDVMNTIHSLYGQLAQWPAEIAQYVDSVFSGDGKFTPDERARVDKKIQDLIEKNKNSGVVCLSEVNDSILMWSHYGHNHSGICIEFERRPDNPLGDPEICAPVQYNSKYPVIDLGKMLLNRDGQTMNLMMRYKADCWASEREWRLITDNGDKECPLPAQISKVIFGLRTPATFREAVAKQCNAKNIRTVQAVKAPMEFKVLVPA